MSTRNYLPTQEAALVEWTGTFLDRILTGFASYGLSQTEANNYKTTRDRFVAIYNSASADVSRTRVVVSEKNIEKKHLINATRMLVRVCEAWPQMTNPKRIELGLPEKKPRAKKQPIPKAKPIVKVLKVDDREVTIGLQQASGERSKPAGVDGANIFVAYGETAPTSESAWELYTGTNKSRVVLTLDKIDEATCVWISAQWLNRSRQAGPASTPMSVQLAAIGVVPQPSGMKIKKAA
jgi:hypothetical protein